MPIENHINFYFHHLTAIDRNGLGNALGKKTDK